MLKPVDILVVLGLLRQPDTSWTVRSLAADLHLPPASVQRALDRLSATPVFANRRLSVVACEDLLAHSLRFVAPVALGAETRGIPTAWAAPPLDADIAEAGSPPVWPDPIGEVRGVELTPLHPAVPALARTNPELYEVLALVDGLRVGDARVRSLAWELLHDRTFDARRVYLT